MLDPRWRVIVLLSVVRHAEHSVPSAIDLQTDIRWACSYTQAGVALVACLGAALRASPVDPMKVLKAA